MADCFFADPRHRLGWIGADGRAGNADCSGPPTHGVEGWLRPSAAGEPTDGMLLLCEAHAAWFRSWWPDGPAPVAMAARASGPTRGGSSWTTGGGAMESIEVEVLSPEREFAVVESERRLAPGDLVQLRDRQGHACSGVVMAALGADPARPALARSAVRLDFADWRGEVPSLSGSIAEVDRRPSSALTVVVSFAEGWPLVHRSCPLAEPLGRTHELARGDLGFVAARLPSTLRRGDAMILLELAGGPAERERLTAETFAELRPAPEETAAAAAVDDLGVAGNVRRRRTLPAVGAREELRIDRAVGHRTNVRSSPSGRERVVQRSPGDGLPGRPPHLALPLD